VSHQLLHAQNKAVRYLNGGIESSGTASPHRSLQPWQALGAAVCFAYRENCSHAQDEAVLAERYLDGAIDALDLLLCADPHVAAMASEEQQQEPACPCSTVREPIPLIGSAEDQLQEPAESCNTGSEPSVSCSRAEHSIASAIEPEQVARTNRNCRCGTAGSVPRRHAGELTYDDFVLQYMAPNLPVMVQVGTKPRSLSCAALKPHLYPSNDVSRHFGSRQLNAEPYSHVVGPVNDPNDPCLIGHRR